MSYLEDRTGFRLRWWTCGWLAWGLMMMGAECELFAQEGTLAWSAPFFVNGFVSSSPAANADGSVIYVGVETATRPSRGRVFAITREGRPKEGWDPAILMAPVNSSPTVAGNTVYVGSDDGRFYALNAETGAIRWQISAGGYITSSPAVSDDTVYFGASDGRLHAVATSSREERWSFPTLNDIDWASPAIGPDGTIYIGSADRTFYAIRPDGTERWRFATGGPIYTSAAIATDGTVFVASSDQRLYALGPNGERKWDVLTNGDLQSSPVLGADGTVYLVSSDGVFYALNPADGSELWRAQYGATSLSTPAVRADGVIIFGADDNRVRAYNPNGTHRWTFSGVQGSGDYIEGSPLVTPDGSIYIGSSDGFVYKLNGSPERSPLSVFSNWPAFRRDVQRTGRAVATTPGQLFNLSTRAQVPAGETVVVGFFVQGASEKAFLLRGVGPGLAQFGISTPLSDPRLDLYSGGRIRTSNDNWVNAQPFDVSETSARVGAFPLTVGSKDAVILDTLPPGLFTAHVSNVETSAGVALVEAYDAIGGDSTARLLNVSTRGPVGASRESYLVAGVSLGGAGPTRLLVRGVGPSLAQFGVGNVLARPAISVYTVPSGTLLRTNSGWTTEGFSHDLAMAARAVAAFPLGASSADAAVLLTLDPGLYTVEISGVNGSTGQALVEMYVLP